MDKTPDIVCVGNATIDVFVILHNLQKFSYDKFSNQISFPLGEKLPLDEYKITIGGNACNVSVGLSRLGLQTSLAAQIANDELSQKITNTLEKEHVNQRLVKKTNRQGPYFNILLSYEGERTILEEKTPDQENLEPGNLNPKLIYLTSVNGDWQSVYQKAFSSNPDSEFALNPGASQINNDLEDILLILPKIEILFVNLSEAQKITKENSTDIKVLLKKLKTWGGKIIVITDGRNGSYAIDSSNGIFQIGVVSGEKPVERTGAGDSYSTGFLYAYLNGFSVKDSMRYGAINADYVIRRVGSQEGLLNKTELDQKAKEQLALTAVKI